MSRDWMEETFRLVKSQHFRPRTANFAHLITCTFHIFLPSNSCIRFTWRRPGPGCPFWLSQVIEGRYAAAVLPSRFLYRQTWSGPSHLPPTWHTKPYLHEYKRCMAGPSGILFTLSTPPHSPRPSFHLSTSLLQPHHHRCSFG